MGLRAAALLRLLKQGLRNVGAGWDHRRCRCLSSSFQGILRHLHCSGLFGARSSSRGGRPRTSRTDDGSGSPARSQDVGSGRPVRDAAAWASLWILKHLCGCAGHHGGGLASLAGPSVTN